MSKTRTKNHNWKRSTNRERKDAKTVTYWHKGGTLVEGRNQRKRTIRAGKLIGEMPRNVNYGRA